MLFHALTAVLLSTADAGGEPAALPIAPLQGDLSVVAGLSEEPVLAGALYVGGALGFALEGAPRLFGGLGVDLTYKAAADPYRISLGPELRAGLAWGSPASLRSVVLPDLLLYLRLTPFGAGVVNQSRDAMGMVQSSSSTRFGLRVGFGLTALYGPRLYFENFPLFDVDGVGGELLKVLLTLVLFPAVMLNHAEVAFEVVGTPPSSTALQFRVGTGF